MKWYKIITEFQSYKWFLFVAFLIPFACGAILKILGKNPAVPSLIFLGMLILWFIIWMIGEIDYRSKYKDLFKK